MLIEDRKPPVSAQPKRAKAIAGAPAKLTFVFGLVVGGTLMSLLGVIALLVVWL